MMTERRAEMDTETMIRNLKKVEDEITRAIRYLLVSLI